MLDLLSFLNTGSDRGSEFSWLQTVEERLEVSPYRP